MKSFTLVGAGRLGTVLAAALARRGWTPKLIVDKDARAAREARRAIGAGRAAVAVRASSRLGDIVFVAVPDTEI
ncbi:MAG: Rossmann-like domain, partial [Candidatus Aminicenantes bacterium]|nr:Rossmann-like domain [Candidatus Aminicenantes bacterium]